MKAESIKGASAEEVRVALEKTIAGGYRPTLAIVFISVKQDRETVVKLMKEYDIDVFGCTSCGEFINDHHSEGEIAVVLFDVGKEKYRLHVEDVENGEVAKAALKLANKIKQSFRKPTFILSSTGVYNDGEYFDGNTLVDVLVKELGDDCVFYGGMAGDDWDIKNAYVFTSVKESGNGMAALVFDGDKISLQGMAIHGWKPLGIARTVTKSLGNKVYSIDGKPAADMYLKYLGMQEKTGDENFNMFVDLSVQFPLIAKREDGETIIKSPRAIDKETGALEMDIPMAEGTEFHFTTPPDFEISEEIISEAQTLKNTLQDQPDALLIFSCAGRPPVLGPLTKMENDGLADTWQVPMAGFYTYGEFGRIKNGKQHFHSAMCCWVTITENGK